MNHSESMANLGAALALAQAEIQGARKDKENPHLRSRYADLASIWDACRGPLTKNGLSVLQPFDADDRSVTVNTVLLHSSGEWMSGSISLPLPLDTKMSTAQAMGSIVTYLRRYSLAAMVGVAPDDDDDGASAPQSHNGYHAAPQAAAVAAGDVWQGPGQCPSCRAPEGKRHASSCKAPADMASAMGMEEARPASAQSQGR